MYKNLFFVCLLLVSLLACERKAPVSQDEMAALYLSQGLQLASGGAHDKAIEAFEEGLQQAPNDLGLLYNQAVAYSELGDLKREKALYLRALNDALPSANNDKKQSLIAAIHYNLAVVLLKQGNEEAAYTHLARSLASLDDVNDYYHSMVDDKELDKIRDAPRFIVMMRKYWPEYRKMIGIHPASSREVIRKKEEALLQGE